MRGSPPLAPPLVCVEKFTLPYLTFSPHQTTLTLTHHLGPGAPIFVVTSETGVDGGASKRKKHARGPRAEDRTGHVPPPSQRTFRKGEGKDGAHGGAERGLGSWAQLGTAGLLSHSTGRPISFHLGKLSQSARALNPSVRLARPLRGEAVPRHGHPSGRSSGRDDGPRAADALGGHRRSRAAQPVWARPRRLRVTRRSGGSRLSVQSHWSLVTLARLHQNRECPFTVRSPLSNHTPSRRRVRVARERWRPSTAVGGQS